MGLQNADGGLQEQTLSKSQDSSITCLQLHLPAEQPMHYKRSFNVIMLVFKRWIFKLPFNLRLSIV